MPDGQMLPAILVLGVACSLSASRPIPTRVGVPSNLRGERMSANSSHELDELSISGGAFQLLRVVYEHRVRGEVEANFPLSNYRIQVSRETPAARFVHIALVPALASGESAGSAPIHSTSLGKEECYIVDSVRLAVLESSNHCGTGWSKRDPRRSCCEDSSDVRFKNDHHQLLFGGDNH